MVSHLTFESEKFKNQLFEVNIIDRSYSRSVKEQADFSQATTIFCNNVLLSFYWGRPVRVASFEEHPTDLNQMVKTELQSCQFN